MSIEVMSSKERIMAAMSGKLPDRVPVQLGITNMFSVYQQNLIGWDVYAHSKVPLWKVVADTQKSFGLDGYLYLRPTEIRRSTDVTSSAKVVEQTEDRIVKRTTISTPEGDLYTASSKMPPIFSVIIRN